MVSTVFRRWVLTWCFFLPVFGVFLVQAAEFKPFLKLQIPGPTALCTLAEKVGAVIDPNDTSGLVASLTPYKNLPGMDPAGTIGLAIQMNEDSVLGMDFVLVLPINDLSKFTLPGLPEEFESMFSLLRMAIPPDGKLELPTPLGKITVYQRKGYFIIATEGAAPSVAASDRKQMFPESEPYTFTVHVDWEDVSAESIEAALGVFSAFPLMLGMSGGGNDTGEGFNIDALLKSVTDLRDEFSSVMADVTLDPKTLDLAGMVQFTPRQGSSWSEKCLNMKNAKTKWDTFLPDNPQMVYVAHCLDYYTDKGADEAKLLLKLLGESFVQGLSEAAEDGNGRKQLTQAAERFLGYVGKVMDVLAENKLADYVVGLDSEGTLLLAMATDKTAAVTKLGEECFGSLAEIFGVETGKTFMESKMKRDYETVAGYSLSCVANVFADLPESVVLPNAVKNIPLSLFWAVKEGEAVVYAAGLDVAKTEQTLKDALARTASAEKPKQIFLFVGLKPLRELLQKQILPLFERAGLEYQEGKELVAKLGDADVKARMVITTEFPDDACRYSFKVNGKVFETFLEVFAELFTPGSGVGAAP